MKILIAGDFCPHERVAHLLEEGDYASVLGDVKDVITEADCSIVNFECPVTKGVEKPIEKLGPNLRCSEKGMEAVKWAGFDCVTLANNHFYDFGDEGVVNTIEVCKRYGVEIVGGGVNLEEASKTFYKLIGNETLAIINCCEHEFSIADDDRAGSNPLNPVQQYYSIQEAKKHADFVMVIVHGGHEHFRLPSPRMVETYRFFIDAGADVVVNHHQHCYSGFEIYGGKPIFYGLGNFCFDNSRHRDDFWNYGYMVRIFLDSSNSTFSLYPYKQCSSKPSVELLEKNSFENDLKKLNATISDANKLKATVEEYYKSCDSHCGDIFEPFYNRFFLAAKYHKFIPSFINRKRKISAANYVCCESHREKLMHFLHR